ncbi:hypothetical protein niasHT_018968 [Heterodera trifolii]|uniref:Uncharacterized protein n=1 Tax=Heterodera trifolii TaxID=157864 RepID=A0ABD2LDY3_9BILA
MDKLSPVPKLQFIFMGFRFVVHFVVFPMPSIPKLNFGARQLSVLIKDLGRKLQKLINDSNYVEEYDPKKRAELKWKLEEELFLDDTDEDKVLRILDELDKMNNEEEKKKYELKHNSTETKTKQKIKMENNRKEIEKMGAKLNILQRHAIQLKILEFLLTSDELFRINHRFDERELAFTIAID